MLQRCNVEVEKSVARFYDHKCDVRYVWYVWFFLNLLDKLLQWLWQTNLRVFKRNVKGIKGEHITQNEWFSCVEG